MSALLRLLRPVPALAGALLIATALLKAGAAGTGSAVPRELPAWRALLILLTQTELLLGAWLCVGRAPRLARRTALALFVAFAVAAFLRARGGESCGCLGPLPASPWWMLALDLVLATLLGLGEWLRPGFAPPLRGRSAWALGSATLLASLWSCWTVATWQPDAPSTAIDPFAGQRVVAFQPEDWLGRRLPLLAYLDGEVDLAHGDWTLVLYRASCSECLEHAPAYRARARTERTAFVALPAAGGADGFRERIGDAGVFAALRPDKEWFLRTPTEIRVKDGIVVP